MSSITISKALTDAHTLDRVVALVNSGTVEGMDAAGGHDLGSNMLAAQYAWMAARDAGYGCSRENLDAHLDVLAEAGATFDRAAALDLAVELAEIEATTDPEDTEAPADAQRECVVRQLTLRGYYSGQDAARGELFVDELADGSYAFSEDGSELVIRSTIREVYEVELNAGEGIFCFDRLGGLDAGISAQAMDQADAQRDAADAQRAQAGGAEPPLRLEAFEDSGGTLYLAVVRGSGVVRCEALFSGFEHASSLGLLESDMLAASRGEYVKWDNAEDDPQAAYARLIASTIGFDDDLGGVDIIATWSPSTGLVAFPNRMGAAGKRWVGVKVEVEDEDGDADPEPTVTYTVPLPCTHLALRRNGLPMMVQVEVSPDGPGLVRLEAFEVAERRVIAEVGAITIRDAVLHKLGMDARSAEEKAVALLGILGFRGARQSDRDRIWVGGDLSRTALEHLGAAVREAAELLCGSPDDNVAEAAAGRLRAAWSLVNASYSPGA